ncbi:hypothetical protein [Microscilla marina]|uniref:Iron-sulfur cluster repair di-iron protein n=1 Tax=Microscilla marina ATCC 23134 TaxID=313606 RepID=A1ZS54_MICM2|nr:hypothetical protein [Microscilla marina]EAY26777.1 hypothetical protein M23134_00743 [Microscilla marina ATCC 23134]
MRLVAKKINELVTENYVYAAVLHYFGIEFYNYSNDTLAQVCKARNLNVEKVVSSLEAIHHQPKELPLNTYPADLVIEYLRHAHYVFINEKLPYMASLIENLDPQKIGNAHTIRDLQLLFPLFTEDFIHHIHEEEDTFFRYVMLLMGASQGHYNASKLHYEMEKNQVHLLAIEHDTHDDEMKGIRDITNNYYLDQNAHLHLRVLFMELQALEKDLQVHAKIENQILFPKALQLELKVKQMLKKRHHYN